MDKKLILASASPRRKEILTLGGFDFTIDLPQNFKEFPPENHLAHELAQQNAQGKARDVAQYYKGQNALILGADTVGSQGTLILEKPKDRQDAIRMLTLMQGRAHEVLTALHLIDTQTGKELTHLEKSTVHFASMTPEEIEDYLQKEDVYDKAAAYDAQGPAALYIHKIEGDPFNVRGFPLAAFYKILKTHFPEF